MLRAMEDERNPQPGRLVEYLNTRFPNVISKEQEVELGQRGAADVDKEYRGKFITEGRQYDQLQRVAGKIFPLAKQDWDVPYTIKLVDSKEINAFALPGCPIYFYKGLMDLASSDDEVASVLGHESSHVVKRHSAKQISDAMIKQFGASIFLGNAGMGRLRSGLKRPSFSSFSLSCSKASCNAPNPAGSRTSTMS